MEKGGTDKAKLVAALKQATGFARPSMLTGGANRSAHGKPDPLEPALRQRDRPSPHARLSRRLPSPPITHRPQ